MRIDAARPGVLTVGVDESDDPAPALQSFGIDVDVKGLDDFGKLVRMEVDAGLKPDTDRVVMEHTRGVGFGERNASGEMQAARQKYRECLNRAIENLTAYVHFSEILASAVDRIASDYRRADALSSTSQQQIEAALATALLDAQKAREEEAKRELHRELARLGLGGGDAQ